MGKVYVRREPAIAGIIGPATPDAYLGRDKPTFSATAGVACCTGVRSDLMLCSSGTFIRVDWLRWVWSDASLCFCAFGRHGTGRASALAKIITLRENAPYLRALVYFRLRYFVRGGFLDETPGLIYHVLHEFWFRFYTDACHYELQRQPTRA
jgi:hypothetical protein